MKNLLRKKDMEYAENNNAKNISIKQNLFMSQKCLLLLYYSYFYSNPFQAIVHFLYPPIW